MFGVGVAVGFSTTVLLELMFLIVVAIHLDKTTKL